MTLDQIVNGLKAHYTKTGFECSDEQILFAANEIKKAFDECQEQDALQTLIQSTQELRH